MRTIRRVKFLWLLVGGVCVTAIASHEAGAQCQDCVYHQFGGTYTCEWFGPAEHGGSICTSYVYSCFHTNECDPQTFNDVFGPDGVTSPSNSKAVASALMIDRLGVVLERNCRGQVIRQRFTEAAAKAARIEMARVVI
jgi:hypothetical protein